MFGICALLRNKKRVAKRPIVTPLGIRFIVCRAIISALFVPRISSAIGWEYRVVRGDTLIGIAGHFLLTQKNGANSSSLTESNNRAAD
ncbi:MAG: hypothetical protein ABIP64_07870 [Burkholderiales bacterium]